MNCDEGICQSTGQLAGDAHKHQNEPKLHLHQFNLGNKVEQLLVAAAAKCTADAHHNGINRMHLFNCIKRRFVSHIHI